MIRVWLASGPIRGALWAWWRRQQPVLTRCWTSRRGALYHSTTCLRRGCVLIFLKTTEINDTVSCDPKGLDSPRARNCWLLTTQGFYFDSPCTVNRMFVPNCNVLVLMLDEVCIMNKSASPFSFWNQIFCVLFFYCWCSSLLISVDQKPPLTYRYATFWILHMYPEPKLCPLVTKVEVINLKKGGQIFFCEGKGGPKFFACQQIGCAIFRMR